MWAELLEKLAALGTSRRFLTAATTVIILVLQDVVGLPISEEHLQQIIWAMWIWILGDSIKSTTSPAVARRMVRRLPRPPTPDT